METSSEKLTQDTPLEAESGNKKLSWFEILGGIIIAPTKTFKYLSTNPHWGLLSVIILLGILVPNGLRNLIYDAMDFFDTANSAGSEMKTALSSFLLLLFFPLSIAISLIIGAAALNLIIRIFKAQASFWPLVSGAAYASVPWVVRYSLEKIISFLVGNPTWPGIDSPGGLLQFVDKNELPFGLANIFAYIDLFNIWSIVLIAILVQCEANISRKRALAVSLLFWGTCVAMGSIPKVF